jgi:GNAT superfamily N-acetyltransferase
MDYTVTEYRDEDRGQVTRLHAQLINKGWRRSQSYLRWKYEENPFITQPLLFVVRYGKQVVGLRGLVGTSWQLGPKQGAIVLPHADDLIIHPDHRNRGLFLLLNDATATAAKDRGFGVMVSLSGGDVTQKISLLAGWKALGELQRLYLGPAQQPSGQRDPGRSVLTRMDYRLKALARGLGFSPGAHLQNRRADRVFQRIVASTNDRITGSREADPPAMSALAESAEPQKYRGTRTETFLRWRLGNPDRTYRFLYWHDSRLRGYLVLSLSGTAGSPVMVADYAVEHPEILSDLFDGLKKSNTTEYSLMGSTLPEDHLTCAEAAGFVPDPTFLKDQRRRFLYFPLNPSAVPEPFSKETESDPALWRVSLLDTMAS